MNIFSQAIIHFVVLKDGPFFSLQKYYFWIRLNFAMLFTVLTAPKDLNLLAAGIIGLRPPSTFLSGIDRFEYENWIFGILFGSVGVITSLNFWMTFWTKPGVLSSPKIGKIIGKKQNRDFRPTKNWKIGFDQMSRPRKIGYCLVLSISIIVTLLLNKRKCNFNETNKSAAKIYSTQQTIYFIGGVHMSGTNLIKDILNQLDQVSLHKMLWFHSQTKLYYIPRYSQYQR